MTTDLWFTSTNVPGIFKKAYLFFRLHLPTLLKITLIITIPIEIIALAAGYLLKSSGVTMILGWTIILIATVGGQLWLTAALILHSIGLCLEEDDLQIERTLKTATQFVRPIFFIYVIIFMLIMLVTLFSSMIIYVFLSNSSPTLVQTVQIFILSLVFFTIYPRLFLSPFFVLNESYDIIGALRKSYEITSQNRSKILAVFLGFFFLNLTTLLLSMMLSFVGFITGIIIIPFTIIIQMFLYIDLKIAHGELTLDEINQKVEQQSENR